MVGVIVRFNMQCDRPTARNVPVPAPPGADELAWQPRVVDQKVERWLAGDVVDDRSALEVVHQPHLPTKAGLFRQPLTENEPSRGAYQRHRKVRCYPPTARA